MKTLDSYIIEKLKIDKDTTISDDAVMPTNKEEFIEFINTYFKKWWYQTTPSSIKTDKNFKSSYDYIIKYANDKMFTVDAAFIHALPVKFIEWMNANYNLGYELK